MGKPGRDTLAAFVDMFAQVKQKTGATIYLTYYLMAAHPGCTQSHMNALHTFVSRRAETAARTGANIHPLTVHHGHLDVPH